MKSKLKKFIISDRFCGFLLCLALCLFVAQFFMQRGTLLRRSFDLACWMFFFLAGQIKWFLVARIKIEAIQLTNQLSVILNNYKSKSGETFKEMGNYNIAIDRVEINKQDLDIHWIEPNLGIGMMRINVNNITGRIVIVGKSISDGFVAATLLSLIKYSKGKQ